jgi:hypothetical protein
MQGTGQLAEGEHAERPRAIRARAILLSFLLSIPVSYACTQQTNSTFFSLIAFPVGVFIVVVFLNAPLRKWAPRAALSQADLIVVFSLLAVAGAMASEYTFVNHATIHQYPLEKDTSKTARELILPNMPDWLIIKDKALVEDIEGGGHGFRYVVGKLPIYFPKYVTWIAFLTMICMAMLCINSLMRGMWCQRERLSFPLIQLPVAMAEKGGAGPAMRSKHLWVAMSLMFAIDMLNGFNYLYPNVPSVPTKTIFDIGTLFKEQPWSSLGLMPIAIYPFMTAVGFFMPNDMLFSFIFFFLLRKATHIIIASQGMPQGVFSGTSAAPGPPYFDEQTWGAVLALFVGAIYFSKGYLKDVWRDIRSGKRADDGGISHRWAFIGLVVSYIAVMAYGLYGDLPVWYMALYTGLYLVFSFVLTRIRAQIGPPTHEFAFFGPDSFMNRFFGTKWLTDRQATYISQVYVIMNRIHRTHPMPYQLEAMKMGSLNRLNQRSVFWSIATITVFVLFISFFFQHIRTYRTGDWGYWQYGEHCLDVVTTDRKGPDLVGITMTLFGFAFVMMLDTIRFRFPAFPLHPAGYVLSLNFGVDYYWFGMLIALVIKSFVQRYYGLRGYDKLRNVALGILIGEYAAELIWITMALITNQSTYTISVNDRGLGSQ